jgi:hypothetical protein
MKSLGWTECDIVELEIENLDATALGIALNVSVRGTHLAGWARAGQSRVHANEQASGAGGTMAAAGGGACA